LEIHVPLTALPLVGGPMLPKLTSGGLNHCENMSVVPFGVAEKDIPWQ
jgi:hypothetical protein